MTSYGVARRERGVLAEWDDDRGFGFITPAAGGSRVFVHVTEFPRGRRPLAGCEVSYAERRDQRNRARASDVQYLGAASSSRSGTNGVLAVLAAATFVFALLVGLLVVDRLSATLVVAYGLISAAAFLMYGVDKSAAEAGRWRTSELTLHAIALMGGWPGALVARRVFRHKTTKEPFRTIFWCTVVINCVALAWIVRAAPLAGAPWHDGT